MIEVIAQKMRKAKRNLLSYVAKLLHSAANSNRRKTVSKQEKFMKIQEYSKNIGIFSTLKMRPITGISHKNDIRMLLKVGKFVGIQPNYK